ncbi:hypothetical protein PR048_013706 [Dryococelus australis]|uniref:Uncharacterized protein n=1 Tax=Dryococelus australis TaxID=614101 RepID=A0ABQ9HSX7_9NEOP|nr:hypothetical protein PR048_013706 [Dryococelus australis]
MASLLSSELVISSTSISRTQKNYFMNARKRKHTKNGSFVPNPGHDQVKLLVWVCKICYRIHTGSFRKKKEVLPSTLMDQDTAREFDLHMRKLFHPRHVASNVVDESLYPAVKKI